MRHRPRWLAALGLRLLTVLAGVPLVSPGLALAQVVVSDGGSPSYSQAIAVPPGVAGMSPKLGLFYAGAGVNGPVGQGWSVQGLSSIVRCPASIATDGRKDGVGYAPDDKLCLDGQRLVQIDGSGNALTGVGTNDASGLATGTYREFRAEKDSYARIRAYGYANADATGASGPAYFKVWTKSGQIYEYGDSPSKDANTKALIAPFGKTVAIAWAVARVSDTLGNFIDFKYQQRDVAWGSGPTAGSPTKGHEWNILEVQYSGNKVLFTYTDRAATLPRDAAETYHQGSKNINLSLLRSITTYVNATNTAVLGAGSGTAVKTVNLTYDNGSVSGRSRLVDIRECAGNALSTRCLPATAFVYGAGGSDAYQSASAFNQTTLAMQNAAGTLGVFQGDFDGDGKTDFIRWSDTPSQNQIYRSVGDGSFALVSGFNITDQNLFKSDGCYYTVPADFNGDGVVDLLRYSASKNLAGTTCAAYGPVYIYLGDGDGTFTRVTPSGPTFQRTLSTALPCNSVCQLEGGHVGWTAGANFFLIDVDGDGRLDVLTTILPRYDTQDFPTNPCASTTCTWYWRGNGDGSFTSKPTNLVHATIYTAPTATSGVGAPMNVVDIDGDGLSDLLGIRTNYYSTHWAYRSSGDGNFVAIDTGSGCSLPVDFNGDSRTDCASPAADGLPANNALYASTGAGEFVSVAGFDLKSATEELGPAFGQPATLGAVGVDVNGDGRGDILRWKDDPAQNAVYRSNGDGTFTLSTSFNLDGTGGVQLKKSDGTANFLVGDFTGRGNAEILRMQTVGGTTSNALYVKSNPTPPDLLTSAATATKLTTTFYYVPLPNSVPSNGVSGSYGARYVNDRGTPALEAVYPTIDISLPMYVVATSQADSGVGSAKVTTEYSYKGLKADLQGRGLLGFREVLRQNPGANGNPLTVDTQYLQVQPYIGVASRTDTYNAALNAGASGNRLSTTLNVYCDQSALAGAGSATDTAPCPVTAKIQRPFLLRTTETGKDLTGAALPQVVTQNTFNATGDPTSIVVTTSGSVAGVSQTFTKTTTNTYFANNTACSDIQTCDWILGRLQRASVQSQVPNSLPSIAASAGNGAYATATAGSGPTRFATLTSSLAFGNRAFGSSTTLSVYLTNDSATAVTFTVPTAASVSGTDFSFVSTTCSSPIAPAAICAINIKFQPTATTARTGTLTVVTQAGSLTSALTGTGTGSTATRTSAATLTAATAWYGATARTVTATYRNDGNVAMTLASPSLAAPLSVSSNTCSAVAPAASCSIVVSAATNVAGIAQSQSFTPTGATVAPAATTVAWTNYTAVPRWSPTSLAFGNVVVGLSSALNITLTNDGNRVYNWATNNAVVNAPTGYTFNTSACASVAAGGGSCNVVVTFTPPTAATYSGSGLTMSSDSYSANTFSVSGTGRTPPSISASPTSLSSATIAPTAASGTVTFTNGGQTATTLTLSVTGGSTLSTTTRSCPANGSCGSVTVTSPTGAGTYNGTLSVSSSAGGSVPSVPVNFSVQNATGTLSVNPTTASKTANGGAGVSFPVTVTNAGPGAVSALSVVLTRTSGTIGSLSRFSDLCTGQTLASGTSCTFQLRFDSGCPTAGTSIWSVSTTGTLAANTAVLTVTGVTTAHICY